jgi:iron-sulfur cluster repair protein YtfE (RIC family)
MSMYTEAQVKAIAEEYAKSYAIMDSVQMEYKYDTWYKHYNKSLANEQSIVNLNIKLLDQLNQETHAQQFNQEMVTKLTDNIVTRFSNRIKELLK